MGFVKALRQPASRPMLGFILLLGTSLLLALLWSLDVQLQGHLLGWM